MDPLGGLLEGQTPGLSGLGPGEPQKHTAMEDVSHEGPSGTAGIYSTCDLWDSETARGVCGQLNDLRFLLHPQRWHLDLISVF